MMESRFDTGMKVRKEVLGSEYVERAQAGTSEFDADFQRFILRHSAALETTCEEIRYEHANTRWHHWGWPSRVTALAAPGQGRD
jgi:hypothetical protein